MTAAAIIQSLNTDGLTLAANESRLIVTPADRITDAHRALIRTHKAEILVLLAANDAAPPPLVYASPDRLADTRRTCRRCRELARNGRCMAAGRGELPMTARQYEPVTDRLERCIGYLPGSDDPDQRPGRERYPHLAARAGR
jgi:hypothetical protein